MTGVISASGDSPAAREAPAVVPPHAGIPHWVVRSGMTGWLLLGVAGAAAVLLGAQGLAPALILLAVLLFVNNVLQNFFAPVAYGSSLNLDPLVVLLVTTGAGLIGGIGLIVLAAPVTAVISRTARRLATARHRHLRLHEDSDPAPAQA